jgi:SAM-dependent methyltransferase
VAWAVVGKKIDDTIPRIEIVVRRGRSLSPPERALRAGIGAALTPLCLGISSMMGAPGVEFHMRCMLLGARLIATRPSRRSFRKSYDLMFRPMDSTRYFEFDALWRWAHPTPTGQRLLDVSSPRLFPIMLLHNNPGLRASLTNPHEQDLALTREMVSLLGLDERCDLLALPVAELAYQPGTFDIVTCISVLEHIVDDDEAINRMWRLLKPGGRLLVTVPTAAQRSVQWIDENEYGLLEPDERGFVFWERVYDQGLLDERLFRVAGNPTRKAICGERRSGTFFENAMRKRRDPWYPFWLEPVWMAREFAPFPSVESLPGEGVMAVEFVKA